MKSKPLPCPFCASLPKFHREKKHLPEITNDYWSLGCTNKLCNSAPIVFDDVKALALEKWNRRHISPVSEVRISMDDKPPFVARNGTLLFLVNEMEAVAKSQIIIVRGLILEGFHFNDGGDYGPGDIVTIGPITDTWTRLSVASFKCSECNYRGPSVEDVLIHKAENHQPA